VAGACGTGHGGLVWAEMAFSFSLGFLIPFLFFYRVFKSKFKLGFKFKLMQHSKEYFKPSMMQHVMTQNVLAK
jgi:hypothetical protein